MTSERVLGVSEAADRQITTLIQKSHRSYMDVNTSVEWSRGVDKARFPKRQDAAWLYGTRHWQPLSVEQRREVAWAEMGRDISMFIWLEQILPTLYMGYLARYGDALPRSVREYLAIFSKEEIVHTLMFRRYLELSGVDWFSPPPAIQRLFVEQLPQVPPVMGVLGTFLIEAIAELGMMYQINDPDCDPLTREIARLHHSEEVRHLAFARRIVECFVDQASPEETARVRAFAEPLLEGMVAGFTYNPELPRHVGFALGIAEDDEAAIREIRASPNNQRLRRERFGSMLAWLRKLALIGPEPTGAGPR